MKNIGIAILVVFFTVKSNAQNPENWTSKQLIQPSELAKTITGNKDVPVIISVGPGALIANSFDAGMASTKDGISQLKTKLNTLPKDQKIVIYCGCCPFEHCPNVRPAIDALKQMNFTNFYLLNLTHNIKKDWIDQGYPVKKS